jgi:hypothetical protein
MVRKKISQLDPKQNLSATDMVPIVDTQSARLRTKRTTIGDIRTFVDAVPNAARAAANGVATLDGAAKLQVSQLPALAVKETYVVVSESAMLALGAQMGDQAVREDVNKTFVLLGNNPAVLSNWQEILASKPAIGDITNVDPTVPPDKAVLVYDPLTQLWRPALIDKLTDGGEF